MNSNTPKSSTSAQHVIFHYPPELLQLLRDTIPLLCRSKPDVLVFFQGAGVPSTLYADIRQKVDTDPKGISKYKIAGDILERLNNKKDNHLRELREVVRRVTEFEDFSTCWENDQLKAKGLVAEVRRVVDVKDAFTRMRIERETEAAKTKASTELKIKAVQERREKIETISKDLNSLFAESDAHKRGKALESVLNRLFEAMGCSFGNLSPSKGIVEKESSNRSMASWKLTVICTSSK